MTLEEYNALKPGTPVEVDIYEIEEIIGSLKKIKKTDGCRIVCIYLGKNQVSIPLVSYPHGIILRNINHDLINNVNNVNEISVFRIHKEDFAELFICDEPAKLNYDNDSILLIYNDDNHLNEVKVTDSEYARFCYFEPDLSSAYFRIRFINGYNIATPDDIKIHAYVINFYYGSGLYNGSIPADRVYLLSKDSILCDLNVPHGKISFVIERNKKDDNDELAPSSYFIVTTTGINLGGDSHD